MPFGKEGTPEREKYNKLYEIIKDAVAESKIGFTSKRADDIMKPGSILIDIIHDLDKSKIVIADLSENNPNVMYELGIRHSRCVFIRHPSTSNYFFMI